jgi:hypothetical protein
MKCPACSSTNVDDYGYGYNPGESDKKWVYTMICFDCSYVGHRRKYTTWRDNCGGAGCIHPSWSSKILRQSCKYCGMKNKVLGQEPDICFQCYLGIKLKC